MILYGIQTDIKNMSYINEMSVRAENDLAGEEPDYKAFMATELTLVRALHDAGSGGLQVAQYRSQLLDTIITSIFQKCLTDAHIQTTKNKISILAIGGYGRGHLNPSSDIDILFLLPKPSRSLTDLESNFIQSILYKLWDLGLKLGHATRSIPECIAEGKADQQSKTAMMEARYITGYQGSLEPYLEKFEKSCVLKGTDEFFDLRRNDIKSRHKKYSHTVFLQEPHVKESCGDALTDVEPIDAEISCVRQ